MTACSRPAAFTLGVLACLALSSCSTTPLTSTVPSAPTGSICEGLFGDPLDFEGGRAPQQLALLAVMGDPNYELRCTYGMSGVDEFILAVTALDRVPDGSRIIQDLLGQGFLEEKTPQGAALTSAGRFGVVNAEAHLVTDESWIRVTAVSTRDSGALDHTVLDHAESLALIRPWLGDIDQRVHSR